MCPFMWSGMILQPPLVSLEHPGGSDHFCAHGCRSPGQFLSPQAEHAHCCSSHSRTSSPCCVYLRKKTISAARGNSPTNMARVEWAQPGSQDSSPHADPWGLSTLTSACRFAFLQMVQPEFPNPAKSRQVLDWNEENICLARLRRHLVVQDWKQMAIRKTKLPTPALC